MAEKYTFFTSLVRFKGKDGVYRFPVTGISVPEGEAVSIPGPKGEKGDPGDSAYDVAVKAGFVGTIQQWLASLKGATGATGATGPAYTPSQGDIDAIVQAVLLQIPNADTIPNGDEEAW